MGLARQDFLVRFPEITEAGTAPIFFRDAAPQMATGLGAAIPDGKSQDLPGTVAHDRPEPAFVLAESHKGPQFVIFEDVVRFSWQEGRFQRWLLLDFFLSQAASVVREMPKMRAMPRMLGRSR